MVQRSPFRPSRWPRARSAVVGAGDDHVADAGLVRVRQAHFATSRVIAEAMITGLSVEFGDKLSSGREHDRVESCGRSETQALNASSVVVATSPTWIRP